MKVAVFYNSARKGSTWNSTEIFLKALSNLQTVEVDRYDLSQTMTQFCHGCFKCIEKGEALCPHRAQVQVVADSILDADLVILTSPVYGMDVSAQVKNLLDHLCFMWLSHRPEPQMFHTLGLTVVTSAGAGLKHATKTLQNSLRFWGVKKTYSIKVPVAASSWETVKPEVKAKLEKRLYLLAEQVAYDYSRGAKLKGNLFRGVMFRIMRQMHQKNDWNLVDRGHWESHGWLIGEKPF